VDTAIVTIAPHADGDTDHGRVGRRRRSLIVNFPGSPNSIRELLPVIAPVLEHAVATLRRKRGHILWAIELPDLTRHFGSPDRLSNAALRELHA
jgi:hypothetical protein